MNLLPVSFTDVFPYVCSLPCLEEGRLGNERRKMIRVGTAAVFTVLFVDLFYDCLLL
jgi:hypothetical protein